ncbi:hypothetical protein APHAL10511_006210 [Amanita phalloides]|nr:hypothetical protein APHAL10511_006210 [Amanita phalloides]
MPPTRPVPLPLARRLLFPALPPAAPYPPLLAASAHPDLAPEIFDLIAQALRAYISPWWSKLSRYDREFVPEINRILIHVIHVFESRVCTIDLPRLLLRDLPLILTQHYRDYRNAASKLSSSYANGGSASLPFLFHQSQPHMAISPDGQLNEDYYRQIIDHLLHISLPPEDYAVDAVRYITREAILKVLLVDVLPKLTQPWFIQLAMLNLLGFDVQLGSYIPSKAPPSKPSLSSTASHSFLITLLSTVQKLSGVSLTILHAYKQAVNTIKSVNQFPARQPTPSTDQSDAEASEGNSSDSLPMPSERTSTALRPSSHLTSSPPATILPLLVLFSEMLGMAERLAALVMTTILFFITILWTSFLDRLLPHLLTTTLDSTFILNLTRLVKRTLFPNGYPGPPYDDPTPEEQSLIRARLTAARPSGILAYFTPIILGPDPTATLDAAIEPLSNSTCNLHLAVIIIDRILAGLFPELIHSDKVSP